MNYKTKNLTRKLTSGLAALSVMLLLNSIVNAATSATGSESNTSAAEGSDSSSSSHRGITIRSPRDTVVINESGVTVDSGESSEPPQSPMPPRRWRPREFGESSKNAIVGIGHNSTLGEGEHADSVVSILGSSTSAGEVADAVVAVLGDSRVTGPVGDNVVAVLGNSYVNSDVGGDVVAVLGDVELGPQANVDGQVVSVGGTIKRDPAAQIRGGVQNVAFGVHGISFAWLHPWIEHCLMYGRMLAFAPGLGWAWTFALVSLILYVFTAMMFRRGVEECMQVLEERPGHAVLAALLTTLAAPITIVLLAVTVIGILAIPFVGVALLMAESFGKLVMLAWIGKRVTRSASAGLMAHPAFAVLIGGVIVTLLYCVPVLGFVLYKLLGFIGMGVVIYALLLQMRLRREEKRASVNGTRANSNDQTSAAPVSPDDMDANAAHSFAAHESTVNQATANEAQQAEPAKTSTISPAAALAYPRASFGIRMAALLLDVILVGVLMHMVIDSQHLHLLVLAGYGALMWKLKGTTIGGIVFNLQVVRLDGRDIDWATAIVRALSCFLSLFVVALGFIWIAFDDEKQAWHDKIAGTVVVRLPKGVSLL